MTERGRRAQRAQDRDVGLLVGDRHHQRRDEVERGHRDDQRQDDEHHALLDLHRGEPVAVRCASSRAPATSRPQALRRARRPTSRRLRTGRRACSRTPVGAVERKSLRGVVEVDQREAAVVFVVADLEDADHGELLEPRHHAGRRDLALRRDQRHLVADAHAERARQLGAEHDAELAGHEARRARRRCMCAARSATFASSLGIDAAHDAPRMSSPRASSACAATNGAAPTTCGLLRAPRPRSRCQSASAPPSASQISMCETTREHAVAHLLLEAVHHRQHDDQRRDAERDAEHRDAAR